MAVLSYSHPEHVTIKKGVWMSPQPGVPVLRQVVLDTTDVRTLAEFYRRLLDLQYLPGDEHPGADAPDARGQDWLVLRRLDGSTALAFQKVEQLPSATWPNGPHPQMLHLDLTVPNRAAGRGPPARPGPGRPGAHGPLRRRGGAALGLCRPRRPPFLHLRRPGRWWLSHHHWPGERALELQGGADPRSAPPPSQHRKRIRIRGSARPCRIALGYSAGVQARVLGKPSTDFIALAARSLRSRSRSARPSAATPPPTTGTRGRCSRTATTKS